MLAHIKEILKFDNVFYFFERIEGGQILLGTSLMKVIFNKYDVEYEVK
jgi:hypothetical protein